MAHDYFKGVAGLAYAGPPGPVSRQTHTLAQWQADKARLAAWRDEDAAESRAADRTFTWWALTVAGFLVSVIVWAAGHPC